MQLGETHALRVFDHHQRRVRHVHADLDHGGRNQQLNPARLEREHGCVLLGRRHAAVDETHTHLGQRLRKGGGSLLRCLIAQLVRLVDERTHPVHLPAGAARRHDPRDDFVTPLFGYHDGFDGRAARRQLIDDRDVEIRVSGHRERARNRGRRHDELVRKTTVLLCLFLQPQALLNAEAVLLVDDDERELRELDAFLKERVCADDDAQLPRGDRFEGAAAQARRL